MEYRKLNQARKQFLKENKEESYVLLNGEIPVLISAPHGVSQNRLGRYKCAEPLSLTTALYLQRQKQTYLLAKTNNNFDDANYDDNSDYQLEIDKLVERNKITHLIDFHCLRSSRECEVNLGTNFERNISTDKKLFQKLYNKLQQEGFVVLCDSPFVGGRQTIAGYTKFRHENMWTLEVEINSKLAMVKDNHERYYKLLKIFTEWIDEINKEKD